jgi:hypothetical protein
VRRLSWAQCSRADVMAITKCRAVENTPLSYSPPYGPDLATPPQKRTSGLPLSHDGASYGGGRVGLPGQQRPSERLWATPRRLADKPAPSLHSVRPQKKPRQEAGLFRPPPGLPTSRRSANPPIQYHRRLHTARRTRMKKPRRSRAKSVMWAAKKQEETRPTPRQYHRNGCTARGDSHSGKTRAHEQGGWPHLDRWSLSG